MCQWQEEFQGKCNSTAVCRRKSDLLSAEWKKLKCKRPSQYQFSEVQTAPDLWMCSHSVAGTGATRSEEGTDKALLRGTQLNPRDQVECT